MSRLGQSRLAESRLRQRGFRLGGAYFTPASLFANSEPGVWYDPSDLTTLFQDDAGTTPVTAAGQTVGLMLDKSQGLTLGPEEHEDPSFDNSGVWSAPGEWVVSGGTATIVNPTGKFDLREDDSLAEKPGYYEVTISLDTNDLGVQLRGRSTGSSGSETITGTGEKTAIIYLAADEIGQDIAVRPATVGTGTITLTSFSVRELPGYHATKDTAAARPTYQTDGTYHWLEFDGVDDFMETPTITPGTDKAQVFAGVRKLSDETIGLIMSLEAGTSEESGVELFAPRRLLSPFNDYAFRSRGSTNNADATAAGYSAPITNVLTGIGETGADTSILRVNGSQVAAEGINQGTANYRSLPLYIGARSGTSLQFNGHIYSLITRFGSNLDTATIESSETYVADKTGVTL